MKRVIGVLVALTTLLSAAPTASARMDLPTYTFTEPAEDFGLVGPLICDYVWRKGVKGLGNMVAVANGYDFQGLASARVNRPRVSTTRDGRSTS